MPKNLWEKGQSGNPNGRPKKQNTLTDILKELGESNKVDIKGKTVEWKTALMYKLWQLALGGDKASIQHIYDRYEGRPKDKIEHSGSIGELDEETIKEQINELLKLREKDEL